MPKALEEMLYIIIICVCVYMCVCYMCAGAHGDEKRVSEPLELES